MGATTWRSDADLGLLPNVPPRLRERILKGEFVEFDDLLPENLSFQSPDSVELQTATTEGSQRQLTINLGRPKRRVTNFSAWMDA